MLLWKPELSLAVFIVKSLGTQVIFPHVQRSKLCGHCDIICGYVSEDWIQDARKKGRCQNIAYPPTLTVWIFSPDSKITVYCEGLWLSVLIYKSKTTVVFRSTLLLPFTVKITRLRLSAVLLPPHRPLPHPDDKLFISPIQRDSPQQSAITIVKNTLFSTRPKDCVWKNFTGWARGRVELLSGEVTSHLFVWAVIAFRFTVQYFPMTAI